MKPNGRNGKKLKIPSETEPRTSSLSLNSCNHSDLNGANGKNSSPFHILRKERGLSQRDFAKKLGLPRARLQRLENRSWERLARDFEALAKALGLKMEELFSRFNGRLQESLTRSHVKKPFFSLELEKGRFSSLLPKPNECFIGTFTLLPQKTFSKEEVPHGELVFYLVLEGELLLTRASKEQVYKEGECFSLTGHVEYELYNPHQFRPLVALLVSLPSFIRSSS